jgi:mono/diheme cytochrome c family protein
VIALNMRLPRLVSALAIVSCIALSCSSAFAAGSKAAEAAGAVLFRDKGCAYCHGATAQGTQKGPSLANVRKALKPVQIAAQIENGGQKMPSFEDSLSKDEVAQLVAFLRAKHRPVPPPVAAKAQTPAP